MAYLAPIHRPSSVRHAIKLSFLSPDSDDLIIAKANRIEIYSPNEQQPDQLTLQHTRSLYGKITLLHKLRPATSRTDHLFVGTDRYHYFTLSWDAETKQLKTEKAYQDIAEKAARDSQTGDRVAIDPTSRFMALECYEGVVNVLPIAHAGKGKRRAADNEIGEIGDPIPVRVPELFVRSSCFVHKRQAGARPANPEFALLYEDSTNKVRLKVRELDFQPSLRPQEEPHSVELEKGRDAQGGELELGASHLIPLPAPMYGMLVVGETSVSYIDEWDYKITDTQPLDEATVFVAWCAVDDQRYVLADDYGKLYLLFVEQNSQGEYVSHRIDMLGETSRASMLVYLDAGRIFVGSHQGDSQVIQIAQQSLEVVQTFPNIAPILDFTVMDMGNRSSDAPVNEFSSGQARIVTGSGAFKDGSLRSVRSGVGLEDLGSICELGAPVSAIFSLRGTASAPSADTLIVSFVSHTRIFRFSADGEVEEVEVFGGYELGESTLYAGNLADGRAVQVTGSAVLLTDADDSMVAGSWRPPGSGNSITAVAAEGDNVLVSLGGAMLVALDISGGKVTVRAQKAFEGSSQVSCIALAGAIRGACVAGFWQDSKVSVLDLRTLEPIASEKVADDDSPAVPRSLIVANILRDQPATLFVGLADGNVITYTVESAQRPFTARKSIILGTQQANFALLPKSDGLENVFATCEHPSLIYGSEGRMVYSAVTAESASSICSFDSEAYPNAIAIAANDELKLAEVDEERTTHVQTLPVHETVRRIAYSTELKAFGLGTIKRTLVAGQEEVVSHFKLVDEVAFQELHTFALNQDELVESVMRCRLDDGSGDEAERFVVGTAYLDDQEPDTPRGRILVFEVTESRQLKLVTELELRGACRCLAMCRGRIVAALIKTVRLARRYSHYDVVLIISGGRLLIRIRNPQLTVPGEEGLLPHRHRPHRRHRQRHHHRRHGPDEIRLPRRIHPRAQRDPRHPGRSRPTLRNAVGHGGRQRGREHLPRIRRRGQPGRAPTRRERVLGRRPPAAARDLRNAAGGDGEPDPAHRRATHGRRDRHPAGLPRHRRGKYLPLRAHRAGETGFVDAHAGEDGRDGGESRVRAVCEVPGVPQSGQGYGGGRPQSVCGWGVDRAVFGLWDTGAGGDCEGAGGGRGGGQGDGGEFEADAVMCG